jgi:hypothetical protein
LVKGCSGLSLSGLSFLKLVDLSLKGFDLCFHFREIDTSLFLRSVHRLQLSLGSFFLLNARNRVFKELHFSQVLLLFLVVT